MASVNHIVVIPDGNRRWAKKQGLPANFGHREGAKTTEKILNAALDLKIPYFTIWGCSRDNITKRSKSEVNFLFLLFGKYFKKLLTDKKIDKNQVRVRIFGRFQELFPKKLSEIMLANVKRTEKYDKYNLTFLMAYSGVDEMLETFKKVAELKEKKAKIVIDEKLIKENLWTKDLPPVDLVIRTAGEPHWSSGFMMWDVANAFLHFTETLWPDFSESEFKRIIQDFSSRERRFGK